MKVLIVDDDANLIEMAAAALSDSCEVLKAADGRQGLALAQREKPDAIILDLIMPEMPGVDVLDALKNVDATARIPVVVMTAFNFTPEEAQAIQARPNVKGWLAKPFTLQKLKAVIEALAGRKSVLGISLNWPRA